VAAVHGAMENEKEEKIAATPWYRSGSGYASLCVVAWFVLNMIIANLNKWIMGKQGYGFRYSALLTVLHMLACWVLSALTLQLRTGSSQRQLSARARRAVLQLSTIFVVSVCCGNAALMYIHVSFSQAIGATAPLWTVVFTVTLTRRKYPPLVWAALALISLGMVLTITGEINFHPIGFALVLVATLTRALKSLMQGLLLSSVDERLDPIELLYYMAPRSALCLSGWVLLRERQFVFDEALLDGGLWVCILASSLVSFFLNVANFLVTKATSPVTLQVLGNIKVVLLIMLSVAIFGNEVSLQAACGCAVCIAGVVLYNHGLRSAPTKPRTDIQPGTPPSPAMPRC